MPVSRSFGNSFVEQMRIPFHVLKSQGNIVPAVKGPIAPFFSLSRNNTISGTRYWPAAKSWRYLLAEKFSFDMNRERTNCSGLEKEGERQPFTVLERIGERG
jgi:hypothetical protein